MTPHLDWESVTSGDGTISFATMGRGPVTLLFLHGLGASSLVWKMNAPVLSQYVTCVVADLPGNGVSPTPARTPDALFPESVDALLRRLNRPVILVGHSMGAQLAVHAALRRPELCAGLVLMAPAGFETFNPIEAFAYEQGLRMSAYLSNQELAIAQSVHASFFSTHPLAQELVDAFIEEYRRRPGGEFQRIIDYSVRWMLRNPVLSSLSKLKVPVLTIFGAEDALIPNRFIHPVTTRSIAEDGQRRLKNGQLRLLDGCGHFPQIERAEEVNRMIFEWVQSR